MKKSYLSPDLEIIKLQTNDMLLHVSRDENIKETGFIEDPDPGLEGDEL